MAHFRAVIQGSKGEASRLGSKSSGLQASIDGWGCGVDVVAGYDEGTGEDYFRVTLTSGSGYGPSKLLGVFTKADLEPETPIFRGRRAEDA